jgi:hypothetical protein
MKINCFVIQSISAVGTIIGSLLEHGLVTSGSSHVAYLLNPFLPSSRFKYLLCKSMLNYFVF